jgi:uncharacterized protein (TIGR02301 family)
VRLAPHTSRAVVLVTVGLALAVPLAAAVAQQADSAAVVTLPGDAIPATAASAPSQRVIAAPPEAVIIPALPGPVPQPPQAAASAEPVYSDAPAEDAAVELPEDASVAWTASDVPVSEAAAPGAISQPAPRRTGRPRIALSDAGGSAWDDSAADRALIEREPRRERELDPVKRSKLTELSRLLGRMHALRVSCGSRDDQTWRSRMATLLDLEAPSGGNLRDPLVEAFNAGFQTGGRGTASCPPDQRAAEGALAAQGRRLALALAADYRAPAQVTAPAAAAAQALPAATARPSAAPATARPERSPSTRTGTPATPVAGAR